MTAVLKGQTVTFVCSSYLEDGTCLDGDDDAAPIEMQAGMAGPNPFSTSVAGLLVGMMPDEIQSYVLPARQAFGEVDPRKVIRLSRQSLPAIRVGAELNVKLPPNQYSGNGRAGAVSGVVVDMDRNYAFIDTNHPFAGQKISIKIKVISVK